MFISIKKHKKILKKEIEETAQLYQRTINSLQEELKEAKNLKLILEKLYPMNEFFVSGDCVLRNSAGGYSLNFPDTVLQYTDDIIGGKVIKQEGTKCLVISKDGNVKTGLTKQKADKGYSYKLIRN